MGYKCVNSHPTPKKKHERFLQHNSPSLQKNATLHCGAKHPRQDPQYSAWRNFLGLFFKGVEQRPPKKDCTRCWLINGWLKSYYELSGLIYKYLLESSHILIFWAGMSPKTPPIQQGLGLKSDTQTKGLEWSREKKQVTLHDFSILKDMQHANICKNRV